MCKRTPLKMNPTLLEPNQVTCTVKHLTGYMYDAPMVLKWVNGKN